MTMEELPDGEYAIVELFGHTTLVGRITEVERFGSKMMAIQTLFGGKLLGEIYHGGAAIYRITPCSKQVAWDRHPRDLWKLPVTLRAVVPPDLLPPPESATDGHDDYCVDGDEGAF